MLQHTTYLQTIVYDVLFTTLCITSPVNYWLQQLVIQYGIKINPRQRNGTLVGVEVNRTKYEKIPGLQTQIYVYTSEPGCNYAMLPEMMH